MQDPVSEMSASPLPPLLTGGCLIRLSGLPPTVTSCGEPSGPIRLRQASLSPSSAAERLQLHEAEDRPTVPGEEAARSRQQVLCAS